MALRPEPESVLDLLQDLQRRVRDLESAQAGKRTAINRGATTAVDDNGVVYARFGLLSDGSYGIEARQTDGTYRKLT